MNLRMKKEQKRDEKAGEKLNKEFEREEEKSKTFINSDDISFEKKSVLFFICDLQIYLLETRHKLSKEQQQVVMDEMISMMNYTDGLQPCEVILTVLGWGPPLGGVLRHARQYEGSPRSGCWGIWPWCRSWTRLLRSGNLQAG